jgi:hypothetical protein
MVNYRDLCSQILDIDSIVFAGVITMDGSVLFSGYKKDGNLKLSADDALKSMFKAAIQMGTRMELLDNFGGIKYACAEYGTISEYTIPLDRTETLLCVFKDNSKMKSSDHMLEQIFAIINKQASDRRLV